MSQIRQAPVDKGGILFLELILIIVLPLALNIIKNYPCSKGIREKSTLDLKLRLRTFKYDWLKIFILQ